MSDKTSDLYFDDEPVLLDVFRDTFASDYHILTALTLFEARHALSRCPDVVISDMSMSKISGTEFLREATRASPGSVRILLTGRASVFDVVEEVTSGVVQVFINKSWDEAGVRRAIERATLVRPASKPFNPTLSRGPGGARRRGPTVFAGRRILCLHNAVAARPRSCGPPTSTLGVLTPSTPNPLRKETARSGRGYTALRSTTEC